MNKLRYYCTLETYFLGNVYCLVHWSSSYIQHRGGTHIVSCVLCWSEASRFTLLSLAALSSPPLSRRSFNVHFYFIYTNDNGCPMQNYDSFKSYKFNLQMRLEWVCHWYIHYVWIRKHTRNNLSSILLKRMFQDFEKFDQNCFPLVI